MASPELSVRLFYVGQPFAVSEQVPQAGDEQKGANQAHDDTYGGEPGRKQRAPISVFDEQERIGDQAEEHDGIEQRQDESDRDSAFYKLSHNSIIKMVKLSRPLRGGYTCNRPPRMGMGKVKGNTKKETRTAPPLIIGFHPSRQKHIRSHK